MKVITGTYRSSVQIKFDVSFLQVLRDRKQQIENAKTDEEIEETIDDSDESKMSARKWDANYKNVLINFSICLFDKPREEETFFGFIIGNR